MLATLEHVENDIKVIQFERVSFKDLWRTEMLFDRRLKRKASTAICFFYRTISLTLLL